MKKLNIFVISAILCLPFLGGCGKTLEYEPKKLDHLNVVTANSWQEKDNVRVLIKKFDTQMNEYYFNKSTLKTHAYQITIQNHSDNEWVFAPENINVILASSESVQKDLNPSFGRAFGMQFMFGPVMGSTYAFKQFETKERIAKDIGQKSFDRAMTIPIGKKRSTLIFIYPQDIKQRISLTLLHTDIPNKILDFSLRMP